MDEFEKFQVIAREIYPGCTLQNFWSLAGGISAEVNTLELIQPDNSTDRVVVRRYGPTDLASNPDIAQLEYRLLKFLHTAGIPVPEPYLADDSGNIFPTPYIVIEFVDGDTDLNPDNPREQVTQLAQLLAQIHLVKYADLSFLPEKKARVDVVLKLRPVTFDESMQEARVREVLSAAWPLSGHNPSGILHGDFWPGNILWRDGQIVAVIDWEDAERGDPLADLANARLEILWALGWDVMKLFTHTYLSQNTLDITNLPFWDLVAALRTASKIQAWSVATEALWIEQRREFVQQALRKLEIKS